MTHAARSPRRALGQEWGCPYHVCLDKEAEAACREALRGAPARMDRRGIGLAGRKRTRWRVNLDERRSPIVRCVEENVAKACQPAAGRARARCGSVRLCAHKWRPCRRTVTGRQRNIGSLMAAGLTPSDRIYAPAAGGAPQRRDAVPQRPPRPGSALQSTAQRSKASRHRRRTAVDAEECGGL